MASKKAGAFVFSYGRWIGVFVLVLSWGFYGMAETTEKLPRMSTSGASCGFMVCLMLFYMKICRIF